MKPRVFIASSAESIEIAEAICYNLDFVAEVTTWSAGFFQLTSSALSSLLAGLEDFDFGVFLLSPADVMVVRDKKVSIARDNVVFELGLFIGRLGPERCFIVTPRDSPDLQLPSDVAGLKPATYDSARSDGNWKAALVYACSDIKDAIRRHGRRSTVGPIEPTIAPDKPVQPATPLKPAVVDQSLTAPNNLGASINEGVAFVAQTYTAGIRGILAGVSVNIHSKRELNPSRGFPKYDLKVAIASVKVGFPDTVLAATVLRTDQSLLSNVITFQEKVEQDPGEQYAIIASYENAPTSGPDQWLGNWAGCTGNQYPYGNLCFSKDGRTWVINAINEHDVHFRTYVVPS